MMPLPSLWTEEDQKVLDNLVRRRGLADVALGLSKISLARHDDPRLSHLHVEWAAVGKSLIEIYDHIAKGKSLP